jgi:hypothetical protein
VHTHARRACCKVSQRRSETGEGRLKAVLVLALLAAAIYSAWKVVPAYVSEYQLSDKMQELARFAVVNHYSEQQIRDNVFKAVEELDIPAKKEDIRVVVNNYAVKISLDYTVPLDLFLYHTDLHFSPTSQDKPLI